VNLSVVHFNDLFDDGEAEAAAVDEPESLK
jgi:hypothetical protein